MTSMTGVKSGAISDEISVGLRWEVFITPPSSNRPYVHSGRGLKDENVFFVSFRPSFTDADMGK